MLVPRTAGRYFPTNMDSITLRSARFLQGLTEEELAAFQNILAVADYQRGEKVVTEGTAAHAFYILLKGKLHVRRMAQKREMLLARLEPGSFFGEMHLLEPGKVTATIYAMEPVSIASVEYDKLRDFMAANPTIGYRIITGLMAELARRLQATNERFVQAMYWSSLNAPEPSS